MLKKHIFTLFIFFASLNAAFAIPNSNDNRAVGFYGGVNAGPGVIDERDIFEGGDTDTTINGYGWAVYAGYNFIPYLGVEGGFMQNYASHGDGVRKRSGTINVPYLALRGNIPLGTRLSLFGKVGYTYYNDRLTLEQKKSGSATVVAAGLGYALNKSWTLTGQYQASLGLFENVGSIAFGAEYHFA